MLTDLQVRTDGAAQRMVQTVRETLAQVEPRLPVVEVLPLSDRLTRGVMQDRMVAGLTAIFGALALLLASLGLYGTISYGISRRMAELGLRMALGADRSMVLWMVLREAMTLVAVGVAAGIPLAYRRGARHCGPVVRGHPRRSPGLRRGRRRAAGRRDRGSVLACA